MKRASFPPGAAAVEYLSTDLEAPTRAYRVARWMLLIPLVATVDVFKYIGRGGPAGYGFLLLAAVPALVPWLRSRGLLVRRPTAGDGILALLWLFALLGTTYALMFNRTAQTTRPMVATMSLAFLYLFVLDSPTDEETGRILQTLAWITGLYIFVAAVVNIGLIPFLLQYRQYRNSQFAFVTGGLAAAFVLRRWRLLAVLAALEVVNFIGYPSATSILGLITMVGTLYITGARAPKMRTSWIVAILSVMVAVSLLNFQATLGIVSDYFSAVGKYNATSGRLAVWQTGLEQFHNSPLVGHAFAGSTVATAVRATGSTLQLPFHNDLVLFLAEGGLLGLGLFLLWAIATEMTLLRRFTAFRDSGHFPPADLIRIYLVMFNTFLVCSVFNPTFNAIPPAATLFTLYGVVMLLGRPGATEMPRTSSLAP